MSGTQTASRQLIMLDQWQGMNQQDGRSSIQDQECAWLENFHPIGPANLQQIPDAAAAIWSAPSGVTIDSFACYVRAGIRYASCFLSDNSATEVNLSTGAATTIGAAATFPTIAGTIPRVASWGDQGILIITAPAATGGNGYFAWDGALYAVGAAAPSWLAPSGATMPEAWGNAITVYQSRVITSDQVGGIAISAPSNGASFATSDGGVSFASTDPFLTWRFNDVSQAAGFLYLFGDSSINVISDLQTSGSPASTTFYNANVDPQTGHGFPTPGVAFGRALVFANQSGIYALLGGAAKKISDKVNKLFASADWTFTPSMGLALIDGVKVLCFLIRTVDYSGALRNVLLMWDGQRWFVGSQTPTLTFIAHSIQNTAIDTWGTDGSGLFKLFTAGTQASGTIVTKLYPGPHPLVIKRLRNAYLDMAGTGSSVSVAVQTDRGTVSSNLSISAAMAWANSSGAVLTWVNASGGALAWQVNGEQLTGGAVSGAGLLLGAKLSSPAGGSGSFTNIARFAMSFDEVTEYGG